MMDGQTSERSATATVTQTTPDRGRTAADSTGSDPLIPSTFWVVLTIGCLLFLIYPLRDLAQPHTSAGRWFVALTGMVIYVGIYLRLMLHEPFRAAPLSPREVRTHVLLLAVIVAIVLFLTIADNPTWSWFVLYANVIAGVKLPARVATIVIAAQTLVVLGIGSAAIGWDAVNPAVATVLATSTLLIGVSGMLTAIRELRAARREIARLAVADERLRFARDLHDLLGHSLSSITLKNELARRMVRKDPERAVRELDEAIAMERAALREVREAVAGYRQPTLTAEFQSAREILEASGIACRCEDTTAALLPAVESVLAWAVREGVTNVVRHSRARHCTIRTAQTDGTVSAEIVDDGSGTTLSPAEIAVSTGNGLRGLAERAARQGGHLEAEPCAAGGFRLCVVVPIDDVARAERVTPERMRTP